MRRFDREIKDFSEIVEVLRRSDTIRLGIFDKEYPYVVPLSFGYEAQNDGVAIYFHGAKEGKKHELIEKNNKVCVEASIFYRAVQIPDSGTVTVEYESFIGFGTAAVVNGAEAIKGLKLICAHAGFKDFDFGGEESLGVTRVYRIDLKDFSGKRRFV